MKFTVKIYAVQASAPPGTAPTLFYESGPFERASAAIDSGEAWALLHIPGKPFRLEIRERGTAPAVLVAHYNENHGLKAALGKVSS